MEKIVQRVTSVCHTDRVWLREFLAEFLGTFLLVFIGNNSVAQSVLSSESAGQFVSVNFGYGFAVTMGVLVAGGVSGGHINPAVTLTLALVGKFPFRKVAHYVVAQYLGAFLAAGATYVVYIDAINSYEAGSNRPIMGDGATAGIFATYPQTFLSEEVGFADQVFGTGILLAVVCALSDPKNRVPKSLAPVFVGLTVVAIGMSMGFNCGYPINPARDLAPRFFTAIAGWTWRVFTIRTWSYIPLVAPHVGGLLGALIYMFFIEAHSPHDDQLPVAADRDSKEMEIKQV
ncbi:aquaporin-10-like [Cloeon dipterum]|uniref:aquaporin-10-like n=1 Tax=Cloeon dipterum TaxID=197152 RepID=UPI00321F8690